MVGEVHVLHIFAVLDYNGNLCVTEGSYAGMRGFPLSQRSFLLHLGLHSRPRRTVLFFLFFCYFYFIFILVVIDIYVYCFFKCLCISIKEHDEADSESESNSGRKQT